MDNVKNISPIQEIDSKLSLVEGAFEVLIRRFFPNGGDNYLNFIENGNFQNLEPLDDAYSTVLDIINKKFLDELPKEVGGKFELEIQQKRIEGNKMYFEYLHDVFAKHFKFINEHFQLAIKPYFRKDPKFVSLVYRFYQPLYSSDVDFLKNISHRYLGVFEDLETIVTENYPDYKRLLISSTLVKEEEYFRTAYSKEKLIELFEGLNNNYINCSSEQFLRIFEPSLIPIKKIKWLSTEFNLLMLFSGHQITGGKRISTHNGNNLPLIQKFFANKRGKDFNVKQLGVTYQKLDITLEPRESKKLVDVLKKLNR